VISQNQLHPAEQLHDHINLIIASPTSTTPLVHAIGRIGTKVLVPPSPVDSNLRAHTWGLQFRLLLFMAILQTNKLDQTFFLNK
jgi:hypothetical protein